MVHATIASFVRAVDVPSAFSALVIGAPNVSAAIIAFIHCLLGAQAPSTIQCRFSDRSVYRLFLFGSLSGFVGNTIMAFALTKNSLILLVTGRFCVGFSSAEIVQRELVASCTPSQVVSESARLVIYKVAGMVAGFSLSVLLTFVVEMIVGDGTNISSSRIEGLQNGSWIMAVLWLCHYIRILLTVIQPGDSFLDTTNARSTVPSAPDAFKHYDVADDHGSDSESSSSVHIGTPSSVMHGTLLKDAIDDPIETALVGVDPDLARRDHSRGAYQLKPGVTLAKVMSRFRKLFAFHVGIPVMLMITFFVTLSLEIFFTASPMVVKRYFAWTGEEAGLLLVCLSLFILPIHVVCEMVARRYEERTILKVLHLVCVLIKLSNPRLTFIIFLV